MITVNNIDDMQKYYDAASNTYRFIGENNKYENVTINCDICVAANLSANNINAHDVRALNTKACAILANNVHAMSIDAINIDVHSVNSHSIRALDINAQILKTQVLEASDVIADRIDARDISYFSVCIARESFRCKSITGRRKNAIHKCLDREIEFVDT